MLPGHLAIGVALKAFFPSVAAAPIIFGVALHDLLWAGALLLKVERIDPDRAGSGPYLFFNLSFIDWTHSLATASAIALVWALLFARRGRATAAAALAAGLSHIASDWSVHNHDMALYPGADEHFGCSLYEKLGAWEWALEGLFTAACVGVAQAQFVKRGVSLTRVWVILGAMVLNMSPWASPLWYVAGLKQPIAQEVAAGLTAVSLGLPCAYLTYYFNREERKGALKKTK